MQAGTCNADGERWTCVAIMAIWTCRSVVAAVVFSSRAVSLSPWLDLCIPRGVPDCPSLGIRHSAIVAASALSSPFTVLQGFSAYAPSSMHCCLFDSTDAVQGKRLMFRHAAHKSKIRCHAPRKRKQAPSINALPCKQTVALFLFFARSGYYSGCRALSFAAHVSALFKTRRHLDPEPVATISVRPVCRAPACCWLLGPALPPRLYASQPLCLPVGWLRKVRHHDSWFQRVAI